MNLNLNKKLLSVLIVSVLAVALATPLAAQKVSVGLKGGVNLANMAGAPDAADMSTLFVGGGFLVARLTDNLTLMPELLYARKGLEDQEEGATEMVRLDYIEVPVLLRFSPATAGRRFVPFGMLGPAIAFKVNCELKGETPTESVSMDCAESGIGDANGLDFGVVGGIGSDFIVKRGAISIDARYTYGLNKVWDDRDWHNSVFSIMLGYRFSTSPERVAVLR